MAGSKSLNLKPSPLAEITRRNAAARNTGAGCRSLAGFLAGPGKVCKNRVALMMPRTGGCPWWCGLQSCLLLMCEQLVHPDPVLPPVPVIALACARRWIRVPQAAAAKYNVPNFSGDAMDVITHPDVDAVWICSPSQYHADQVRPHEIFQVDVSPPIYAPSYFQRLCP